MPSENNNLRFMILLTHTMGLVSLFPLGLALDYITRSFKHDSTFMSLTENK